MERLMADIAMSSYESAMGRRMGAIPYAFQERMLPSQQILAALSAGQMYQTPLEKEIDRLMAEYARTQYGFLPYLTQLATGGPGVSTTRGVSPAWELGGDISGAAATIMAAMMMMP
jgi:hypothetical protein